MDFIDEKIEQYAYDHTSEESELLTKLEKETYEKLEIPQMTTGRIEAGLLKLLARLVEARRILEIGTFGGYSALSMAEALPEDGALVTCDNDPVAIAFAQKYFSESPHGKKIKQMEGPALESIKKLTGTFDMAFIDADKITKKNDGLLIDWGERNFVNPPYSRKLKEAFIERSVYFKNKGRLCVMLLPVSTSTKVFHDVILPNADDIRFLRGRVKFEGINTFGEIVKNKAGMHDSMVVVFDGTKKEGRK
ncbi:MAG: methyltransferase [Nitrospinae bacterium]|nr:methyltransferase [Nitrospinota bacterium]